MVWKHTSTSVSQVEQQYARFLEEPGNLENLRLQLYLSRSQNSLEFALKSAKTWTPKKNVKQKMIMYTKND